MSIQKSTQYNATVVGREVINPQLLVLRVRPDAADYAFTPGQFAVLGLRAEEPRVPESDWEEVAAEPDRMIKRAYSIASASVERGYLEFYLALVTSGELTPRLFALPHGARLFVGPRASGFFTLDRVPPAKAVVLVATGTGLAPYVSMLRTLLITETVRKFVVLHGARCSWDLGYRGELESLARLRQNFTYIPSITRPEQDPHFRGQTGRIQKLVSDGLVEKLSGVRLDPADTDVFLCGNPDMILQVKSLLLQRGFTSDQGKQSGTLHVEEYW